MGTRTGLSVSLFVILIASLIAAFTLGGCGAKCNSPAGPGNGDAQKMGSLFVTSAPAGAAIFVNSDNAGAVTDTLLADLNTGDYVVRIALPGYAVAPESLVVTVADGDTADAPFTLTLTASGSIALLSDPPGAAITVDGLPTGVVTPDTLEDVLIGEHVVSVSLAGYWATKADTVIVEEDALSERSYTLTTIPPRVVLIEHFSNTGCDPCVNVEKNIDSLLTHEFGPDLVVGIGNHLNFPYPPDPFFLANPQQFIERGNLFGVNSLPRVMIDGEWFEDTNVYAALRSEVEAAMTVEPLFETTVDIEIVAGEAVVSGSVKNGLATAEGDEKLMVVLIETGIHHDAQNGVTHFDDIIRRYLTGTAGQDLALGPGEETTFQFSYPIQSGWNSANLEAVVFVQSSSTRTVYQAGSSR